MQNERHPQLRNPAGPAPTWRAPRVQRFAAGAAEFGFDTAPEGQTGLS
jgi:hypothetical protein